MPRELIRHCFFTVGVYEEGFCVSGGFWPQNMWGIGIGDHYQEKAWITFITFMSLITGRLQFKEYLRITG